MLRQERLDKIVGHVEKDYKVTLEEMSQLLNVSSDTVRRDIKELSDKGLIKAVRGGAMANLALPYAERENIDAEAKKIIARKTRQFFKAGMVVFIDAGTTTVSATNEISQHIPMTIVTNSFPVANAMVHHPLVDVLFLGGQLNKQAFSTNGHETIQAIKNIYAHMYLIGVCSINKQNGVTSADYTDTLVKKAMFENSNFVVALSTFDKLGGCDPYKVCDIEAIDVLITDKDPDTIGIREFREAGITVY